MKDGKNYNYYDNRDLQQAVKPFIRKTFISQHEICGRPEEGICLGEGKNLRFMLKLNEELGLFKQIHPLPHPRFIMQYRMKQMNDYLNQYVDVLANIIR